MATVTTDPLTTPRSIGELTGIADQQAAQEIAGQVDPLQAQVGSEQRREAGALKGIGSLFDTMMPYAANEVTRVQDSYDQSQASQHAIFAEAQSRLDQLKQSRAAEAQALAQKMGGPVAVGEFTAGVEPDQAALANIAGGSQLHALANAEAGVQEASAFSGRVLPALRSEETARARGDYEDKIRELEDHIATIRGQGAGLRNSKLNDLIAGERDFELKQASQTLDKIKADRDWEAAKRSLHNDDVRLQLAQKQFGISEAGVTGKYKGKPTLESIKLSVQERQAAQRLGLSVAQYQEMVRHHTETEAVSAQRASNTYQKNAMAILDAATGGGAKGATVTQRVELSATQGAIAVAHGKTNVFKDAKTGKYYTYTNVHLTPQQVQAKYGSGFAKDPQGLYDLLIGSNIPSAMALKLVRTKTGVGDFSPGKPVHYSAEDLNTIGTRSFNELRGIAMARGWKPGPKHNATKQTFIDYILGHQSS